MSLVTGPTEDDDVIRLLESFARVVAVVNFKLALGGAQRAPMVATFECQNAHSMPMRRLQVLLIGKSPERGDGALRSPIDFAHPQWRGAHALRAAFLVLLHRVLWVMSCSICSWRKASASIRVHR
jgi:hypothetical protein